MSSDGITGLGEDHRPRHVGWPTPEFPIEEVAKTAKQNAGRNQGRNKIADTEDRLTRLTSKEDNGGSNPEKSTVEAHACYFWSPGLGTLHCFLARQ